MSLVDHSPPETRVPSAGAWTKFLAGSSSFDKSEAAKVSITLTALMAVMSAILVPSRMLLSSGAPNDSSVFAYIGWAMHRGLMPYRDLWDHKGPLLYSLQFAGISLHPTSTVGIGIMELIAYAAAFFLLYRIVGSFASSRVSLGIAVLSLGFVAHFAEGGNLCESWALLPLAASHYSIWNWSKRRSLWSGPLLTICFTCIFWIRPNMVGFPSVALLFMFYVNNKEADFRAALRFLALAAFAAFVVTGVILLPIYRGGAFHDFIGSYFGYNSAYAGSLSGAVRLLHTRQLIVQLFATGLSVMAIGGWALALKMRVTNKTGEKNLPSVYLAILLCSLPVEIVAACVSGRDYSHYVLPLFPSIAILSAWFVSRIENSTKEPATGGVLALALLLGFFPLFLATYSADFAQSSEPPRSDYLQLVRFIDQTTKPADKIVVVGGDEAAYIAHRAQRLPASRYVYQYPLTDAANPAASEQRRQFMCDLVANRPAVIISGNPLLGVLCSSELECGMRNNHPPLSDYGYNSTVLPKLLKDFIASEYKPVDDPRFEGIHAFVRRDVPVPASW
jgi:hypothetical protein